MTSTEEKPTIVAEKPAPIFFGDESLSDMTLVVGNQDFKVHRMVLASRSDVFKVMFYGNFKEAKEDRIEIKDVSVQNFRRFLEVLYTGKTNDPSEFLEFPYKDYQHVDFVLFLSRVNATSKSSSYRKLFSFWKNATEIMNIADRFNVMPMVKDYFRSAVILDICCCSEDKCHACLNTTIFAIINGMDISKCQKKFPMSLYWDWLDYAGKEPFPTIDENLIYQDFIKTLSQHLY